MSVWAAPLLVGPLPGQGLFDGIARVLFAVWHVRGDLWRHGNLWLSLGVEVALGVIRLAPWFRRTSGLLSPRPTRT
ncbi:hypothetical protein GPZ77_03370 [Streptomyces sp. QHH-9511]|uniref:hypothetical protein n=1 Tax=Streptomyces sp. QHH-9511 TaxID=2684468 RepID=UPI001318BCA7|nr:hypothetical protein [Streptomyces sp. QHH-9511]QGZ47559.1 hypothetical protein GPZ77_03370 [Streptomyces sp. QHH-9511]